MPLGSLNRQPSGLLGFLGIKNGGENPGTLSNILVPTWDAAEQYLATNSEVRLDSVAINAVGNQNFGTVPIGEVWHIGLQSAATGTLGAGQTIEFALMWLDQASLINISTSPMSGARTVGQRASASLSAPYLALPGSSFGILCTQLVAGPVTVSVATRFTRMLM